MFIEEHVALSGYSTMRLGGKARYLTVINSRSEIGEALAWAKDKNLPVIMIGDGSNIVWGDKGFNGLVLVNKILGYELHAEDAENAYVTAGAGENWDSVVERIVTAGWSGVEELSLIPGTAGATPVQNVGAYGREISETLMTLEAYDAEEQKLVTLRGSDCAFAYRTSRFKTTDKGRFFIVSITLHVTKTKPQPPFYASLQSYFTEHNITDYSPQIIREAVMAIRAAKLPDPATVANNGSFFENPIVDQAQLADLQQQFPGIASWPQDNNKAKISAAWLVEQAGFKDMHDSVTGMGTWPKQALVLVNERAGKTADLLAFKQKIVDAVQQKFGITLKQEPEFIEL